MSVLSLAGARPLPLQWEEKTDVGKFIDRLVGNLVPLMFFVLFF